MSDEKLTPSEWLATIFASLVILGVFYVLFLVGA
jgi:hypothetical protein